MNRHSLLIICICSLCLLSGCGGSSSAPPPPPLSITSSAPPNGMTQTAYGVNGNGFTLTALGGVAPYMWSWAAAMGSTLPPGLNLVNGLISGVPTMAGTYSVIVTVSDSQASASQKSANYSVVITNMPPVINTTPPPQGTTNVPYSFTFTAAGGVPPLTWTETGGLPAGIIFGSGGQLSGTPTAAGSFSITVSAMDSGSPPQTASQEFTLVINNPSAPVISTTPLPGSGGVNLPYAAFTFTATGGVPPLTWSESGALPAGLGLSTGGVLSGTPTQTGSFSIEVNVQDSTGVNAVPEPFTIQIFAHGFAPTGSMQVARFGPTSTLLGDGRVLVTGGRDSNYNALASAEIFDPASGTFTLTGSMETTRYFHQATLLSNGQVLVTGGFDAGGNVVAAAELFDAANGNFTPTGSMQTARASHGSTLLNGGKVLVAGGEDANLNSLASAELYDPATRAFTPTGAMQTARAFHTVTPLNNGHVLVTGGTGVSGGFQVSYATAELYDPAVGTFTLTGSMATRRLQQTATLLGNGEVLVTGGIVLDSVENDPTPTAELFDPTSGTFSPTGVMETARWDHTATLLSDGAVLVTGGENYIGPGLSELFDPSSGTFTPTGGMATARLGHTATLLDNGQVLTTGGAEGNGSIPLATAELYQ